MSKSRVKLCAPVSKSSTPSLGECHPLPLHQLLSISSSRGVDAPVPVDREGVEASSFDLLEYVNPQLGDLHVANVSAQASTMHSIAAYRYTPVMNLSRPHIQSFAIDDETVVVPFYNLVQTIVMNRPLLGECANERAQSE
jgi:hypothetical protein